MSLGQFNGLQQPPMRPPKSDADRPVKIRPSPLSPLRTPAVPSLDRTPPRPSLRLPGHPRGRCSPRVRCAFLRPSRERHPGQKIAPNRKRLRAIRCSRNIALPGIDRGDGSRGEQCTGRPIRSKLGRPHCVHSVCALTVPRNAIHSSDSPLKRKNAKTRHPSAG